MNPWQQLMMAYMLGGNTGGMGTNPWGITQAADGTITNAGGAVLRWPDGSTSGPQANSWLQGMQSRVNPWLQAMNGGGGVPGFGVGGQAIDPSLLGSVSPGNPLTGQATATAQGAQATQGLMGYMLGQVGINNPNLSTLLQMQGQGQGDGTQSPQWVAPSPQPSPYAAPGTADYAAFQNMGG